MRIGVGLQPTGLTRGEAPGGGPFSRSASVPCSSYGFPPPRIVNSAVRRKPARAPNGAEWYARSGKPFQPAGRKTTPSSVSPVVTKRQSAMSSLRASAVLAKAGSSSSRVPTRLIGRAVRHHRANALFLGNRRKRQASWIMPRAAFSPGRCPWGSPGVPACFASPCPAACQRRLSSGPACPGQAPRATAFAVTHWPREHLMDQDISRFNAEADDPSQVPYHGVWLGLGLCSNRF